MNERFIASLLAEGQRPADLIGLLLLYTHGRRDGLDELRACPFHELLLRGADVSALRPTGRFGWGPLTGLPGVGPAPVRGMRPLPHPEGRRPQRRRGVDGAPARIGWSLRRLGRRRPRCCPTGRPPKCTRRSSRRRPPGLRLVRGLGLRLGGTAGPRAGTRPRAHPSHALPRRARDRRPVRDLAPEPRGDLADALCTASGAACTVPGRTGRTAGGRPGGRWPGSAAPRSTRSPKMWNASRSRAPGSLRVRHGVAPRRDLRLRDRRPLPRRPPDRGLAVMDTD